jgi:mannuronan synthase
VVTHEVVTNSAVVRTYHNLRRWGGNMVRNNGRAIALGPRRLGWFTWWCLIDQRISIWTTLIGPSALITSALADRWDLAAAYLLWVLLSRVARTVPAWFHGRRVSFFYGPLSAALDWVAALVKMWIWFFPARQFWHNRGNRQLDSTAGSRGIRDRRAVAGLLLGTAAVAFVLGVAHLTGTVLLDRDLAVLAATRHGLPAVFAVGAFLVLVVTLACATDFRIRPPHPVSTFGCEER